MAPRAYRTLDRVVIRLDELSPREAAFVKQLESEMGRPLGEFHALAHSVANPLLPGRWITREYWSSRLRIIVQDMCDRVGIRDGFVGPEPGDDLESSPFIAVEPTGAQVAHAS